MWNAAEVILTHFALLTSPIRLVSDHASPPFSIALTRMNSPDVPANAFVLIYLC